MSAVPILEAAARTAPGPFQAVSRSALGKERWEAFAASCDEAWFFHAWEIQEALLTWPRHQDLGFALVNQQGFPVLICPLFLVRETIKKILPKPRLFTGGGPAASMPEAWEQAVRLIAELAQKTGAWETKITVHPLCPAWREPGAATQPRELFSKCFELPEAQTLVVDLSGGPEAVFARMEGRARTAVRKAEKEGVTVREMTGPDDLTAYYALHKETYQRTGVPPHPEAYFAHLLGPCMARGLTRGWMAEVDGAPAAAATFGLWKQAAFYNTGASTEGGLGAGGNVLAQWAALKTFSEEGVLFCDTGEAFPHAPTGSKEKRLYDYKKSFGGQLQPMLRACLHHSPAWSKWIPGLPKINY